MNKLRLITRILPVLLVLALATGCTHVRPIKVHPTPLPNGAVLPHHVALVVDKSLGDFKYDFSNMGDTWVYPFGIPLQSYARQLASKCFQQVDVVDSVEQGAALNSADLILIPHAVKCDRSLPVWAWDDINLTLVVQWTARDRATQHTVWLTTITGESTETGGNAFTQGKHERILNQQLFDDLSLKTFNAFQQAQELK